MRTLWALCAPWVAAVRRPGNRRRPSRCRLRIEPLESRTLLDAAPSVVDPNLAVQAVVSGLDQPTSMAFLGPNDFLVLEKASGQVKRVVNGTVRATVLDLAVNSNSERGLLGIALHPDFPSNPGVYLYWSCVAPPPPADNPFFPTAERCADDALFGPDSSDVLATPLLGNRVDRFVWNGTSLTFDHNLIMLRSFQNDAAPTPPGQGDALQPPRANHDGGVLRFGPDGKLYMLVGDVGRRGQLQNLPDGPGPAGNQADDQFGGPEPDDAHLTGVILRLNDDGSAPADNPFFAAGANRGGEVGANLQKIFSYGIRNSFGMAFDPFSGHLWNEQNGDDSFTELNRVEPGENAGWVQVMGPVARLAQYKGIETSNAIDPVTMTSYFGLQQLRWSPENIADTPQDALARLFMIFEDGKEFAASLTGRGEVPPVATSAAASADFRLDDDGTLHFVLRAETAIQDVTQAHIHLGGQGQNGPVVVFLFGFNPAGVDFRAGDVIGEGTIRDADVIARPGFTPTVANLVRRMRDGRTYVNVHTVANPGGEVRGQVVVTDEEPVSHYSDPEFSWKFEVAPAAVGFLSSRALGPQYEGDFFVGAARTFLEGGNLFRFNLTGNRRKIAVDDPRLEDRVADNNHKFDITESESLLFGRNFGIATDIQTGPNGNLFVVSLSNGAVYEILRRRPGRPGGRPGRSPAAATLAAPAGDPVSQPASADLVAAAGLMTPAPSASAAPPAASPLTRAAAPAAAPLTAAGVDALFASPRPAGERAAPLSSRPKAPPPAEDVLEDVFRQDLRR